MFFTKIIENLNFCNNSKNKITQKGSGNILNVTISKKGNEFSYAERYLAAEELSKAVKQYCAFLFSGDSRPQIPQICKKRVEDAMKDSLLKLSEDDQERFLLLIRPLLKLNKSDLNQSEDLIRKNQQEIEFLLKHY